MAIQATSPLRSILIGYKELAALAVTLLVIAGAIMDAMQWAIATAVTPLREEIRREITALRGAMTNLRKDISDLSNRVTRVETILEQQRQGTMAPDTP